MILLNSNEEIERFFDFTWKDEDGEYRDNEIEKMRAAVSLPLIQIWY